MDDKQIIFIKKNTAELIDVPYDEPDDNSVVVKTEISTISPGTERANITGDPNVAADDKSEVVFPRALGYSSAGTIVAKGKNVKLEIGDRVVVFWGNHKKYNCVPQENVVKIESPSVSFEEAAISFIATFPLAAIRKTKFEVGESAVVMGLGLLGQLAVKLLRASGAYPIIAVDPIEERRNSAITNGADAAYDPYDKDFVEKVKEKTNGGAKIAIEVTGIGAGLDGVLDVMAKFGRVALLGCTRNKEFTIDYYKKVHFPGIELIGAHTMARPEGYSYPHYFSHNDDIKVVLNLCAGKRLVLKDMIAETHSPTECTEVYNRLVEDRNFPTLVQFDWRNV